MVPMEFTIDRFYLEDLTLTVVRIFLQGFVSYQLPGENLSWSSIFREIENNKDRLGIVDYSVSQTTLDQVRKHSILQGIIN